MNTQNLAIIMLSAACTLNGFSIIDIKRKTDEYREAINILQEEVKRLEGHNVELKDDIECLRHNAHDKVFPCVSTIGVSNEN